MEKQYLKTVKGSVTTYYTMEKIKVYEHYKDDRGREWWSQFDEKGNEIHFRQNNGDEWWCEYNEQGNVTHYKSSSGYERWSDYDKQGNEVHFVDSNGGEWFADWYCIFDTYSEQIVRSKEFTPFLFV